jgi:type IV secretion system protein VirB9
MAVDRNPPWTPVAVYDDGGKTFLRFKESLQHTGAPAVFARHADGTAGLVEFAPYDVPGAPEHGMWYIVQGVWPQLELKGSDGQRVRITRYEGRDTAPR